MSEKRTMDINDGNEVSRLSDSEKIEVYSDKGSFAGDDWKEPEQNEVPKLVELDKPMAMETRRRGRKRTRDESGTV